MREIYPVRNGPFTRYYKGQLQDENENQNEDEDEDEDENKEVQDDLHSYI